MDSHSHSWTSRPAPAPAQRHFRPHHQSSHLDRWGIEDFDVEDEGRSIFSCPYRYEDFDIVSLCVHLEHEHSCESKLTICPICYVKVAEDVLSHITLQHGPSFKLQRRRRLRRLPVPPVHSYSQALSLLGRDLCEGHIRVFLGGGNSTNSASVSNAVTDPFSLILKFPCEDEIAKSEVTNAEDSSTKNMAHAHMWKSSCFDPSLSIEEREKRTRVAAGRSGFVQDLFLLKLLGD